MNKFLIAMALCALLAACQKDDAAATGDTAAPAAGDDAAAQVEPADVSDTDATDIDAPDADAADADAELTPVDAGLPQECEDYLNRAKACFAQANPQMATAFQDAIDQSKAEWDAVADKGQLVPACVQANEQFAQTAAALQCE